MTPEEFQSKCVTPAYPHGDPALMAVEILRLERVNARLVEVCRENVISARIIQAANKDRNYEISRDARFILERIEKILPPR